MNERLLRAVLKLALDRPRSVLLGWAILLVALTPFVLSMEISTSTDKMLNRHSESWDFYQSSIARFGGDEILVAAIESARPFDPELLGELAKLSDEIERLPGVRRVDSLATVPLVWLDEDGSLEFRPALEGGVPQDAEGLASLRARLRADRVVRDALLSDDERVAALNVQLGSDEEIDFDAVVEGVRRVVERHGASVSGVPVFRAEINQRARLEFLTYVALTLLVISVLLYAMLRTLASLGMALGVGLVGTWVTLAGLGATGTALNISTVILPSIMLALGCAYAMHLLAISRGARTRDELEQALLRVIAPTAISGLTTVIGFLAISTTQIDAIRQVAGFGALGVLAVLAAALSAIPAGLRIQPLPVEPTRLEVWVRGPLAHSMGRVAEQHSKLVMVTAAVLVFGCGLGLARVKVETDVTTWFPVGSDVRDSYERIRSQLSGISPVNVVIESERGVVTEVATLAALDQLSSYLGQLEEVGKALSIADPLRQLHGSFVADPEQPLPDDASMIEQYMLLLGSVTYLDDLITPDRTAANVLLRVDHNGSEHLLDVAAKAEAWWAEFGPPGTSARSTGIMYEFALAEDEIAYAQVRGLVLACGAIFVLLFAVYRVPSVAVLAMLPNVLPLVVVFGALGHLGVPLDAGIVISGCLVIGIALDDTVHTVSAFRDALDDGASPRGALERTHGIILFPVLMSSIAIGLGFAVLGISSFTLVRNLGLMVAAVMAICFVADTLLLPPLLQQHAAWSQSRGGSDSARSGVKSAS